MPSQLFFYDTFYDLQWKGLDLAGATINAMLLKSGYTFSAAHVDVAEVLASGANLELATGDGYTQGGGNVANIDVIVAASPKRTALTGDNILWTSLTATFRYALYYIDGVVNAITDPVICCVLLDDTPADIVVSGVNYQLLHSANGIFTSGVAA